ncbi:hypothetical protein XELAEV_18032681mg [Xenopus laevis]|uniref:Uncharacterized protein n=1 Tax=Xenopus laevis TaxID=8355 RepID=A0A974CI41_XENLA|nr:hypothetical protein XELAEV_18032681mg [Xenopus laevis]
MINVFLSMSQSGHGSPYAQWRNYCGGRPCDCIWAGGPFGPDGGGAESTANGKKMAGIGILSDLGQRYFIKYLLSHRYDSMPLWTVGRRQKKQHIMQRLGRRVSRKFGIHLNLRQIQRIWSDLKRRCPGLVLEINQELEGCAGDVGDPPEAEDEEEPGTAAGDEEVNDPAEGLVGRTTVEAAGQEEEVEGSSCGCLGSSSDANKMPSDTAQGLTNRPTSEAARQEVDEREEVEESTRSMKIFHYERALRAVRQRRGRKQLGGSTLGGLHVTVRRMQRQLTQVQRTVNSIYSILHKYFLKCQKESEP